MLKWWSASGIDLTRRSDSSCGMTHEALHMKACMLTLLRDGFNQGWTETIDYDRDAGKKNGVAVRVWLTRPVQTAPSPGGGDPSVFKGLNTLVVLIDQCAVTPGSITPPGAERETVEIS